MLHPPIPCSRVQCMALAGHTMAQFLPDIGTVHTHTHFDLSAVNYIVYYTHITHTHIDSGAVNIYRHTPDSG